MHGDISRPTLSNSHLAMIPPLKWSDLRYVFDIKEDCNGEEAIKA
jgi:hypothetical protein